jgi:hypothetical protein
MDQTIFNVYYFTTEVGVLYVIYRISDLTVTNIKYI